MDGYSEKKWFVYLGDHHEGPFSLEEIQAKLSSGSVAPNQFVWCEGMTDWLAMTDVSAFEGVLSGDAHPIAEPPMEPEASLSAIVLDSPHAEATGPSIQLSHPELEMEAAPQPEPAHELPPAHEEAAPPIEFASSPAIELAPAEFAPPAEAAPPTYDAPPPVAEAPPAYSAPTEIAVPAMVMSSGPVIEEKTGELDKKDLERTRSIGAQSRGGERFAPRLVNFLFLLLIAGGLGASYMQGYLDPVLNSPAVRAGLDTLSDFARPHLLMVVEKVPALGAFISPIPRLEDVSPEEFEELKYAALKGETIGVALSRENVLAPSFYISGALPDGSSVRVLVVGIAHTLLNTLAFQQVASAPVAKRLGKTETFRMDGKPLPRGEYRIYVLPSEPPGALEPLLERLPHGAATGLPVEFRAARVLGSKSYFLGGPKDVTYTQRLNEYHTKLREKAATELGETRQFLATIETQLSSTQVKYDTWRKGKPNARIRKSWEQFHGTWLKLQDQLLQTFQGWTPEKLKNDSFYGVLYELTSQAGRAVSQVHEMHHAFFNGVPDLKSFEIQLGEATSGAQNAISVLKSKIDRAATLAPAVGGIPQREGL